MRLLLLASGSSGNVAYLEAGPAGAPTRLLIDAGLPPAEIEARLERVPSSSSPLTLSQIDAALITHDHRDHAGYAAALKRPLWATSGTRRVRRLEAELVRAGARFQIGAFAIEPVLLPHDADETVGYVLEADGARVGILTDCGHDAPEVARAYAGCRVLALEANHDRELLRLGPYPPSLKRRVSGPRGHLSNEQSAQLLEQMCALAKSPELVIAAHLSRPNNRPLLARRALERALGFSGQVIVASQAGGSPLIEVSREGVRIVPQRRQQLAFDFSPSEVRLQGAST
ncbi:MAG TPA: MBL fold metallo-hydrolase [Polyangia bacterium]